MPRLLFQGARIIKIQLSMLLKYKTYSLIVIISANVTCSLNDTAEIHVLLILTLNNSQSFTQQVKNILIFSFGWMQEPISSVKYYDKLYRPNEWRQNLTFFGTILIVTSNLSWFLLWLQLRGRTNQYFRLDFYHWRQLHLTWSSPMEKLNLRKILEFLMDQPMAAWWWIKFLFLSNLDLVLHIYMVYKTFFTN